MSAKKRDWNEVVLVVPVVEVCSTRWWKGGRDWEVELMVAAETELAVAETEVVGYG